MEEANEGKKREVLLPILLDAVEPPFGFSLIQAADLTKWRIGKPSQSLDLLVHELGLRLGVPLVPHSDKKIDSQKEHEAHFGKLSSRANRWLLASAVIVSIGYFVGYKILERRPSPGSSKAETYLSKEEASAPSDGTSVLVAVDEWPTATPSSVKLPGVVSISFVMHADRPGLVSVRYALDSEHKVYFKSADGSLSKIFVFPAVKVHEISSRVIQDLHLVEVGDSQLALLTLRIEVRSADQSVRSSFSISILGS
jgi:hypothetical protein